MRSKSKIRAAMVAILLVFSQSFCVAPALSQNEGEETPGELAREGMERLLRAIELMLEMIPQYETPEVLPNGDIIIRRKNPRGEETPTEEDEDQART